MSAPLVSALIPTLNGAATIGPLLEALQRQRARGRLEIIAVDSGSRDGTLDMLEAARVRIIDLGGRRFGHASARNRLAGFASGEVLLFLTQDVEPVGDDWLDALVAPLRDPGVAGAFGRQLPRGASPEEAFLAGANYPAAPRIITPDAVTKSFGPGAIFFSNAFGAMRRDVWQRIPLPDIVMSEDQAWGRAVLAAGYRIHYVAAAAVYHGHRLSLGRAFRRNFDSGSALQALGLTGGAWSLGLSHLVREMSWIRSEHGTSAAARALVYETVRMAGFQAGRLERLMPRALARRLGEAPR